VLIGLSLFLAIVFNSIFIKKIFNFANSTFDYSLFHNISSLEQLMLIIPLFIILPSIVIYYILRKLKFEQKLQDMKAAKVIVNILLTLILSYIAIMLLSTTVEGGGLTFGISMIYTFYILPVMILLFIIVISMIIRRLIKCRDNTYHVLPFSQKEIKFFKYIPLLSISMVLITLLNPYGNIVKNFQTNTIFEEQCLNAKTTIYDKIKLDSIFLYTDSENRYCRIDNFKNYNSWGGNILPYPGMIIESNITFETFNHNEKTNNDFKYKYYDNSSEENYRNGVESKILKSKHGYIEKQIYNNNSIIGNSVEIIKLDDNKTIAKSIYYINKNTRKVCGDLIQSDNFEKSCLKPFNLVSDMIKSK